MKDKKCIKCSYGLLIIILFVALAFVTDYCIIEHKLNRCVCLTCDSGINSYNNFSKNIVSERKSFFNEDSSYLTTVEGNDIINISSYDVKLTKNGELSVIYHEDDFSSDIKFVSSNVLNYFIIEYGNGGFRGLYFIYEDGTVGFANIEQSYIEGSEIKIEKNSNLNNIVSIVQGFYSDGLSGYRGPIYINIDRNMYK